MKIKVRLFLFVITLWSDNVKAGLLKTKNQTLHWPKSCDIL